MGGPKRSKGAPLYAIGRKEESPIAIKN